jgi:hypothetical protein
MEFTNNEIEAMRTELAANAVKSLRRQLQYIHGITLHEANDMLADAIQCAPKSINTHISRGFPTKHIPVIRKLCDKNGIFLFRHQFLPNRTVCNMWLQIAYDNDISCHHSKHTFKHWDRKMTRTVKVAA